jgi:hypothetical protein
MPEWTYKLDKMIKRFSGSTSRNGEKETPSAIKLSTVNDFGVYIPPSPSYYHEEGYNSVFYQSGQDYFQIKSQ